MKKKTKQMNPIKQTTSVPSLIVFRNLFIILNKTSQKIKFSRRINIFRKADELFSNIDARKPDIPTSSNFQKCFSFLFEISIL